MEIRKGKLLHDGKRKRVYEVQTENRLILSFKDTACFFEGNIHSPVKNKGKNAASVSSSLFRLLENYHIATHFIQTLKANELVVQKLKIFPFCVMVWNYASSNFAKRYGLDKGKPLDHPVIEFYWKNEKCHYPLLYADHLITFSLANDSEITEIINISRKTNAILKSFFERRNLILADFQLNLGQSEHGILVGDEITPDTCRLWDYQNGRLDLNRFRLDHGKVQSVYQELFERIGIQA